MNFIRNQLLVAESLRWVGIQEVGGNNRGQMVRIFQKHLGGAHNEPWCMSYVQYCCYWADKYAELTGHTGLPHKLYKSEHCMTVWNKTPRECRIDIPFPGCVPIWNYEGTTSGHTGALVGIDRQIILTAEGNTSDGVRRIVREGDGVYKKRRPMKTIGKMKLVGFLNPWPG